LPQFELAHVLEPLERQHALALEHSARRVQDLTLPVTPVEAEPLFGGPHALVVHSGPQDEVLELAELALELRSGPGTAVLVISPEPPVALPLGARWQGVYPVAPHLPHAELIVTAAGFNAVRETAGLRERHHIVPFPRALDDQFWRASMAVKRSPVRAALG
jgi:hypothetical protein